MFIECSVKGSYKIVKSFISAVFVKHMLYHI